MKFINYICGIAVLMLLGIASPLFASYNIAKSTIEEDRRELEKYADKVRYNRKLSERCESCEQGGTVIDITVIEEIADKWYKRGEKEIAYEFDKFYVIYNWNSRAGEIGNKWYNRGEKDLAIKLDDTHIYFMINFAYEWYANFSNSKIVAMADKWLERGEKTVARMFYKIFAESQPRERAMQDVDKIGDKFYDIGEREIALEFYNIYMKHRDWGSGFIGKKLYDRGEKEVAYEIHKNFLQKYPEHADLIGDEWYEGGDKEIAYEFHKNFVKNYPKKSDQIGDKWYERGDKDIAYEFHEIFVKNYPDNADEIIKKWNSEWYFRVNRENVERALALAKKQAQAKPKLAAKIGAKWYEQQGRETALEFYKIYAQTQPDDLDIDAIVNKFMPSYRHASRKDKKIFFKILMQEQKINNIYDVISIFQVSDDYSFLKKHFLDRMLEIDLTALEKAIILGDLEAVIDATSNSDFGYWGKCTPKKEVALILAATMKEKAIFNYLCDIWKPPLTDLENMLKNILNWVCFLEPSNLSSYLYDKYIDL